MLHAPRRLRTIIYVIAGAIFMLWLAFLLFQTGNPWDETEHAHAAWLISEGKRPLDDFFQHHQPLLWDVLSIYFRLGFTGAGVLIWGRILVLISAVLSIGALLLLGRRREPGSSLGLGGVAAAAIFIALTLVQPELFVCRPETLSTALLLVSLALWSRDQSQGWRLFFAGALAAAACYASPRFALLGGLFFFFGQNERRRWALLTLGGVAFLALYTFASGFSVSKVIFNLQFSAHLQSIGDSDFGWPARYWRILAPLVLMQILPLWVAVRSSDRLRGALLLAYLLAVFLGCHLSAGMFRYPQAYAPFLTAAPVVAAWLIARLDASAVRRTRIAMFTTAGMLMLSALAFHSQFRLPGFKLLRLVQIRNVLASRVPPGRTVLVFTEQHPITIADTSYYGSPLFDARNRLCRAVESFKSPIPLPRCDFLHDLQTGRPYILDRNIRWALPLDQVAEFAQWVSENYVPTDLRVDILMEKPAAGAHPSTSEKP